MAIKEFISLIFIILFLCFLFLAIFIHNSSSSPVHRFFSIFQPGADSDRFKYWQVAFRMIQENPYFGKGVGTFMDYFSKYMPNLSVSYAHNCYLQIFAETGIFSILCFLTYIFSMVYLGIKSFMKNKALLLLGFLVGSFAYLIHAFFDTLLYSLPLAFLFWIWVGLLTASLRLNEAI